MKASEVKKFCGYTVSGIAKAKLANLRNLKSGMTLERVIY